MGGVGCRVEGLEEKYGDFNDLHTQIEDCNLVEDLQEQSSISTFWQ